MSANKASSCCGNKLGINETIIKEHSACCDCPVTVDGSSGNCCNCTVIERFFNGHGYSLACNESIDMFTSKNGLTLFGNINGAF
ncbi:hypothetical protein V1503_02255 [Bacillus sp. SCS-151]|uniref:hypothetical protein n=1 Tax=Nanhaiella sioensis TaxID=3115293 RepID=UPI0039784AB2